MNSRERILSAIYLEEPDVVPVSTFQSPYWLRWVEEDTFWRNVKETDAIFRVAPKFPASIHPSCFDHAVWISSDSNLVLKKKTWIENGYENETYVVDTSLRPLECVCRRRVGHEWGALAKPLLECKEDIDAWLSIPYSPVIPDISEFFYWEEKLGNEGIAFSFIGDPVDYVAKLFRIDSFLTNCMSKPKVIHSLLKAMTEQLCDAVAAMCEKGARRFWITGPEYVCPPMLSPKYFDEYVVRYDRKIVELIHQYGGIAYMHSHGKVAKVLPRFVEIGIDALDPLEPPPKGDIDIALAKKAIGEKVCLVGNVDSVLMAKGSTESVKKACKDCIDGAAAGGAYILQPTSGTIVDTPLSNISAFIKAGRLYGQY